MCTLIVLHRVVRSVDGGLPLVVAANRDEFYGRATEPAHGLGDGLWAGVDLEAGGTWLGATEAGFFVGLTNQRSDGPLTQAATSRGLLVLELLRAGSVESAARRLGEVTPGSYNGFNVVVGDGERLLVGYGRPALARVDVRDVEPGVHVLPNDRLNSPAFPKAERTRRAVEELAARATDWPALAEGLATVLADHAEPGPDELPPEPDSPLPPDLRRRLHALCVHTPSYGTRSAAILGLRPGRLVHYETADGPPCTTPFETLVSAS